MRKYPAMVNNGEAGFCTKTLLSCPPACPGNPVGIEFKDALIGIGVTPEQLSRLLVSADRNTVTILAYAAIKAMANVVDQKYGVQPGQCSRLQGRLKP